MKNKKGQIAVLLALSFSVLFLLIAMVINISFLVTAKINLQNSVDLAAYAGAAQQARYLTEIGRWNYEMRRNYKAMTYDYVISLNSELTPSNFKKYINNTGGDVNPVACASLQRQLPDSTGDPVQKTTCSKLDILDFQGPIDQAALISTTMGAAALATCFGPSTTACLASMAGFAASLDQVQNMTDLGTVQSDEFENYKQYKKYNYNRRLIAWMTHGYRHLQSRIRGIHYGGLKIKDRWNLNKKDAAGTNPPIEVFNHSPMSIAAKVVNGYTDLDTPPIPGVIELDSTKNLTNPVHNAAWNTFKNNLISAIAGETIEDAKIFHISPIMPSSGGDARDMSNGCSGECNEFKGPYLRLKQHDVDFMVNYFSMISPSANAFKGSVDTDFVTNFPIGVAKDERIKTYYLVVGVADTTNIPFNVFFGEQEESQIPPLVAVAAARPFGSRIGPYIDENCEDLFSGSNYACVKNGLDPLYPTKSNPFPNFSIRKDRRQDPQNLGVKLAVGLDESGAFNSKNIKAYRNTEGRTRRWRSYFQQNNRGRDDGFIKANLNVNEPNFSDNDSSPMHPMGNRNSIVAWKPFTSDSHITITQSLRDNFEGYLYNNTGQAIYNKWSSDLKEKRTDKTLGQKGYRLYLFRYPKFSTSGWDIAGLVNSFGMEKSFASIMAVNEFEIDKYIIPLKTSLVRQAIPGGEDVLNWAKGINDKSYIFSGSVQRETIKGEGNKPITDYVPFENPDALGTFFPESYTAWRIGLRGYRVKLVNVKELLEFDNALSATYTIPYKNENITIDLSKITY